ncbi:hypothetical protein VTN77DRAFT_4456 [Rasamsonia byssochlamydoides]|uniref:uncharacterized protein n=1 Tax=Rasamsonia byssochlamydoides TaxID=89139 RepID=UPI003743224A
MMSAIQNGLLGWRHRPIYKYFLSLVLTLAAAATNTVHVHDESFIPDIILRVTATNYSQACHERYSVLVNGTSPGPELRFQEGKTTWIRVYNDMEAENVTMHWHGLSMMVAPFSDGTPQASQWPIPPGYFFDYEVHPDVGYAGTYFYHSHVGFQAVSAAGALIVEETTPPPYTYDEERVIVLSDFFHKTDGEIEEGLTSETFTWSGEPDAVLVNGQGKPAKADGSCLLAAIDVEPGKTYRLRFIGATALSFVWLGIEGHDLEIIEADGQYTQPLTTSYMQIASGQRFSALLHTKTDSQLANGTRQFYIQLVTLERPTVITSFAALRYPGANADLTTVPSTPPLPMPSTTNGWLDYQLRPLTPNLDFPRLEEVTWRIVIHVHQNISKNIVWVENGYPWTETVPKSPYLIDIYQDKYDLDAVYDRAMANGGFDTITRTFPAKMGEVLEIVWQNQGSTTGGVETHPFHAHGRHFYDIGGGNGTYDPIANEMRLLSNPPVLRDTTVLYRYREKTRPYANSGWRAWRLRVDDAGVWMMHCHILQHMIMGMQMVFVFGDKEQIVRQTGTASYGYLTFGGPAYGNSTHWPEVVHFF